MTKTAYIKFIKELKEEIILSRYNAAKLVNKELILLYLKVGQLLNNKIETEKWGSKVIENISADLQNNLKGLRGFSVTNLRNMKQFYETYYQFLIHQSPTGELKIKEKSVIHQSLTGEFDSIISRGSSLTNFNNNDFFSTYFLGISFTHHVTILNRTKSIEEKIFYIQKSSENQWTVAVLEYQIDSNYYKKQGKALNNFSKTLPKKLQPTAINAFRDDYLLDFIAIQDPDNMDERELEQGIIGKLKEFILSLGKEFAFIGNQYRIVVDDEEFYIDLLFFHRGLQSLVAIDLKRGKFIPEYTGKMSFYLNALNNIVKLPHENPSIGIILCKEKKDNIVEYSLKDSTKPIGVSNYKFTDKLPKKYKNYLPNPDDLIKILNEPEVEYRVFKNKKINSPVINW